MIAAFGTSIGGTTDGALEMARYVRRHASLHALQQVLTQASG